jgi:3'-5' exoribonuclease
MTLATTPAEARPLLRDVRDGDDIDGVLLVRDVERRRTRDGSPFLRVTLADRAGSVPAVLWEPARDAAERAGAGEAVRVTGRLAEHPRYGRQVTIRELRPAGDPVDWGRLIAGPSRPAAELERELDALIGSVRDPHLAGLLARLLGPDTPSGRGFRVAPAAKVNHHAHPRGLLEHSVAVARQAHDAAATFPGVDRDLAVCGALLHDIGKLEAYAGSAGGADLTDAGRLEGEIALGYFRVRCEIEAAPGFPADRARALLHIVLSHHGRLEYGSPVVPCTREAALVHAADELSGRLGAFDRLERELPAGERWSRHDRTLGTSALFAAPADGER